MGELYDALAGFYDARHDNPWTKLMREAEKPFLRLARGKVLDVGCGTGHHLKMFHGAVGIDPSEGMLRAAGGHGKVVRGKAEGLPFADASFDSVICMFTVLNLCDWKRAVREMACVVKPGGACILSVSSVYDRGWSYMQKTRTKNPPREKAVRIHGRDVKLKLFTRGEVEAEFSRYGMLPERFRGIFIIVIPKWGNFAPIPLRQRLLLVVERLFPQEYAAMYFFAFRKPAGDG